MVKVKFKIIWTDFAKFDLKEIYNFYKEKSLQGAKNVVTDIRKAPKSIHFSGQAQVELYNNKYRRIIVRNYKILYSVNEKKKELVVYGVVGTKQHTNKLKKI